MYSKLSAWERSFFFFLVYIFFVYTCLAATLAFADWRLDDILTTFLCSSVVQDVLSLGRFCHYDSLTSVTHCPSGSVSSSSMLPPSSPLYGFGWSNASKSRKTLQHFLRQTNLPLLFRWCSTYPWFESSVASWIFPSRWTCFFTFNPRCCKTRQNTCAPVGCIFRWSLYKYLRALSSPSDWAVSNRFISLDKTLTSSTQSLWWSPTSRLHARATAPFPFSV